MGSTGDERKKQGAIPGPVGSGRFGCFIYASACNYALYGEGAAAS